MVMSVLLYLCSMHVLLEELLLQLCDVMSYECRITSITITIIMIISVIIISNTKYS